MSDQFIGRGWAFPLRTDSTGGIALTAGSRKIEEAIRLILATSPGERPMRPRFGCRIHEHLFAPISSFTVASIQEDVRVALVEWEPRIDVEEVVVNLDSREAGLVYIDIRYVIKGTNDRRNLVFPFYVIPGGD